MLAKAKFVLTSAKGRDGVREPTKKINPKLKILVNRG
jgi:hypothetical protein